MCEEINETWIADRDRFSYEGLYSEDRLLNPQVRHSDGSWREVEWDQALAAAVPLLKDAAAAPEGLGLLAHSSSTLEELYLLARLADGLGSANLDHRLRRRDFRDQAADARAPELGHAIAAIDELNALLVVGSNLRHEVPILAHRVRKASLRGARIHFINPARFDYLFPVASYLVTSGASEVSTLAAVLRAALGDAAPPPELAPLLKGVVAGDEHRGIAEALKSGARRAIWLGALSARSSRFSELRALARALAAATGASLGELAEGGNGAGAYLAGVLPHRGAAGALRASEGLHARAMLERTLSGYLLLHCEPWADAALPGALEILARSQRVVAVTAYASAEMKRIAQVLLPAGAFAESSGTYVNLEGRWQSQAGAVAPLGAARPAWKILRVLGNLLELPSFDYQSSEAVRDELKTRIDAMPAAAAPVSAASWRGSSGRVGDRSGDVPDRSGIAARGRAAAHARRTRHEPGVRAERASEFPGSHMVDTARVRAVDGVHRAADRDPDSVGGVSDAVGAQAHRLDADAHGSQPRDDFRFRGWLWSALRRCHQTADQGSGGAGARQQGAVHAGPGHHVDTGVRDLGGSADRSQLCHRQCRCRTAVRLVAEFNGRLWRDPGRLVVEFQVRLPGRHALGRADGGLRDRDGFRAGGGTDGIG